VVTRNRLAYHRHQILAIAAPRSRQGEPSGEGLGVPALVAQLLVNRRLGTVEDASRFLEASLNGLHAPGLLPGVDAATDLIFATMQPADASASMAITTSTA